MFECFKCKKKVPNAIALFKHLRMIHALHETNDLILICNYKQCPKQYSTFSGFRKHILKCSKQFPNIENTHQKTINDPILVPDFNSDAEINDTAKRSGADFNNEEGIEIDHTEYKCYYN